MSMITPVIAVDTREQRPYRFPQSEVRALPTGDYSVVGMEDRVAVERKTKSDAYTSLGRGRCRFHREVERLSSLDYGAIVLECSLEGFMQPPPFSQLHPSSAMNTLLAWSVKYGVHVLFAGNRRLGNRLTLRLLEKFARYHHEEADVRSG